jgi:hypothetical protein
MPLAYLGNAKNKEVALKCAKEVLQKQGQRDVYLCGEPLDKELTIDEVAEIKAHNLLLLSVS